MMKKYTIFLIMSCMIFTISTFAYAENNEYIASKVMREVIEDYDENDSIKRGDAVICIMRAIGLSDESVADYYNTNFYTSFASDVVFWDSKFCSDVKTGYMYYAYCNNIMRGTKDNYNTTWLFPNRAVTLEETAVFMSRCIDPDMPEEVCNILLQQNLLYENSAECLNQELTVIEFERVLSAFLNLKGKLYFISGNNIPLKDEEKSLTYADRYIQNNSFSYQSKNDDGIRTITNTYGTVLYSLRDIATAKGETVEWKGDHIILTAQDHSRTIIRIDNKIPHKMAIDDSLYIEHLVYAPKYDENLISFRDSYEYIGEYVFFEDSIYVYRNELTSRIY